MEETQNRRTKSVDRKYKKRSSELLEAIIKGTIFKFNPFGEAAIFTYFHDQNCQKAFFKRKHQHSLMSLTEDSKEAQNPKKINRVLCMQNKIFIPSLFLAKSYAERGNSRP
jgi:hypothetical protein